MKIFRIFKNKEEYNEWHQYLEDNYTGKECTNYSYFLNNKIYDLGLYWQYSGRCIAKLFGSDAWLKGGENAKNI